MKHEHSPWRPAQGAALRWSDAGAPVSTQFEDVYYSRDDGLAESRHVFLSGNGLPDRWREHPHPQFCIGELGFGTGLNFLLTWQAWRALPAPRPDLHYLSIEQYPLTRRDLARAVAAWPALGELAALLLESYPGPLPGQHRILLEGGRVRLDLWWDDVAQALPDLAGRAAPPVDAWYLDGFAPARNAAMWAQPVLHAVAALSRPGASFATFTAAGQVRRDLTGAGFQVSKVPGYGRKRESLRGLLGAAPTPAPDPPAWDLPATQPSRPGSALVIGGGLAGCAVAAALARRGITVTVLDEGAIAGAASGNDQGILYTKLSRHHDAPADFALQSFQFACHMYRTLLQRGLLRTPLDGELCGSFQQSDDDAQLAAFKEVLRNLEDFARVLDREAANELLGIDQPCAGIWFPRAGWLRPAAVCRAWLASDAIRVVEHCGPVTLHTVGGHWQAANGDRIVAEADCAIIAAGTGVKALAQCQWLPLQAIRGQTTQLPAAPAFTDLRAALCHAGYIAPARAAQHCIGATFDLRSAECEPRVRDNQANLQRLAQAVPAWRETLESLDPSALAARVGFRSASADHLPVIGPVPDLSAFLDAFGALRKNARLTLPGCGHYLPGLYISAAHGARGLTSTPLAAELLASLICTEPPPVCRALCRALSPARFIIRDLSRNRI